jgi:DNA-binding response OmpR family regulator
MVTKRQDSPPASVAVGPILVVDDDVAIRSTIAEILRLEGYSVRTAENGAEALKIFDEVRPRLVVLDMRMPILDGWGFARGMKARGINVPTLVLTAAPAGRAWANEIGAQAHISKPFDLDVLVETVERLFRVAKTGTDGQPPAMA